MSANSATKRFKREKYTGGLAGGVPDRQRGDRDQAHGPVLMNEGPRDGLVQAIRHIGNLASRARGKRFDVGQI